VVKQPISPIRVPSSDAYVSSLYFCVILAIRIFAQLPLAVRVIFIELNLLNFVLMVTAATILELLNLTLMAWRDFIWSGRYSKRMLFMVFFCLSGGVHN
jgi:hypothetical protein